MSYSVVRTGFEPVRVIALPIHYDYTTTLVSVTYAIIRATICTHNNLNLPMCVDGNRLPFRHLTLRDTSINQPHRVYHLRESYYSVTTALSYSVVRTGFEPV